MSIERPSRLVWTSLEAQFSAHGRSWRRSHPLTQRASSILLLLTPIRRHLRSWGTPSSTLAADGPPSRASPDSSPLRHRCDPAAARPAASELTLGGNRAHNLRTQYTPEGSRRVRRCAAAPVRFPINSRATAEVDAEDVSLSKSWWGKIKEVRVFGKRAHPTRGCARVYAQPPTDHLWKAFSVKSHNSASVVV